MVHLAIRIVIAAAAANMAVNAASATPSPCPCASLAWCFPITAPPPAREVFVFYLGDAPWQTFEWQTITTVAIYLPVDGALLCAAHAAGVRVVAVVEYDGELGDASGVAAWAGATAAVFCGLEWVVSGEASIDQFVFSALTDVAANFAISAATGNDVSQ